MPRIELSRRGQTQRGQTQRGQTQRGRRNDVILQEEYEKINWLQNNNLLEYLKKYSIEEMYTQIKKIDKENITKNFVNFLNDFWYIPEITNFIQEQCKQYDYFWKSKPKIFKMLKKTNKNICHEVNTAASDAEFVKIPMTEAEFYPEDDKKDDSKVGGNKRRKTMKKKRKNRKTSKRY